MVTAIRLDDSSDLPLYRQLYEQIAVMVRDGILPYGERLPATRELAADLGLNRTTISAAYELLEADGLIQGHVGRGSFVNYRPAAPDTAAEFVSFVSSRPGADQFPLADFQACCREVAHGADVLSILQLGSPAGYAPLRKYLLEQSRAEGSARPDDDIAVTNGCQQALDLVSRVLAPAGTSVVVENPVYHGLKNVFTAAGARLIGIATGEQGIDIERLERVVAAERPKLIVVTPNFQNPTGGTMPLEARLAVVRLSRENHVTLVENDLYGDLRYRGDGLPTLKEVDESGRTILLRSFSKIAFPGLRVGWVIGPAKVIAELADARQWCDLHTDQLAQGILWRFAASGRLSAHLQRVRQAGLERLEAALAACEAHLPPGSRFTRPEGGMNIWVRLPDGLDAALLLPLAEREGVAYVPGRHFGVDSYDPRTLRLSFAGLPPGRIETGIAILGRIFRQELENGARAGRFESSPALV
jgi:DNA-binding transcriptional MocR family regulator